MTDPATGRCECGAIRFTISGEPVAQRMCWCRTCQRLAAGNATVNAMFRWTDLGVEGAPAWYAYAADSGNAMRRAFCPACGTPLFNRGAARPDLFVVRIGALDEPARFAPQSAIWVDEKPGWADRCAALPTVPGQPKPPVPPPAAG